MSKPIHVSRLQPHPSNVRENLGDLAELTASIRAQGILQPLVAEPASTEGRYTVLAGHRRLAAAKRAGLEMVPVTVRRAAGDEAKAIEVMLVENCQRRDLGPIEKAEAMGKLRDRGYSVTAIARAIGLTVSTVSTYLAYLDLDDSSRERVRSGTVTSGEALAAVRKARRGRAGRKGGRPVVAQPAWFTGRHPLASYAREMCDHTRRPMIGGVACGQCWEQAIRDDSGEPGDPGPEPARLSPRQERMQILAEMRLHTGSERHPPPGFVTARKAAERLGVTSRTIERYKRDLATAGGA